MPEEKDSNLDRNSREPENKQVGESTEPVSRPDAHFKNWWWGVIPAVLAIGLLLFWLTGQYEEIFGIDPRGLWKGTTMIIPKPVDDQDGVDPGSRQDRWELLIKDVAGDMWLKVTRNGDEVVSGAVEMEDNSLSIDVPAGNFHGVYTTTSIRFRYNPFAERYIDSVILITGEGAYSVRFKRV